jgi:hypothetical protein
MRFRHGGNGSSRFEIGQQDMGGWLRVFPRRRNRTPPKDLPLYLSHTLAEWFRQRPNLRVRFVVPIQKDDDKVELHM